MSEPKQSFRQWYELKKKAKKSSVVPTEVAEILGKAPVLLGEDQEWYEETRAKFAAVIKPEDSIIWIFVDEFAYYTAEILRERRMKSALVSLACQQALYELINGPITKGQVKIEIDIDELVVAYFLRGTVMVQIDELFGVNIELITATAYSALRDNLQGIDKSLASLEARRILILREIELRRMAVARRLREISQQIIDTPEANPAPAIPSHAMPRNFEAERPAAANDDLSLGGNDLSSGGQGISEPNVEVPETLSESLLQPDNQAANLQDPVQVQPSTTAVETEGPSPQS